MDIKLKDSEINKLTSSIDDKEKEKVKLEERMNAMADENKSNLQVTKEEYKQEIKDLRDQHKKDIEEMRKEYEAKLQNLNQEHNDKIIKILQNKQEIDKDK